MEVSTKVSVSKCQSKMQKDIPRNTHIILKTLYSYEDVKYGLLDIRGRFLKEALFPESSTRASFSLHLSTRNRGKVLSSSPKVKREGQCKALDAHFLPLVWETAMNRLLSRKSRE